uniref:Uncharacterized protein n=1 Tax=Anguilla anguilla TaxID=7936 RepID=A0A0E9XA87_ANGAN
MKSRQIPVNTDPKLYILGEITEKIYNYYFHTTDSEIESY